METRKTKKAEISFWGACLWKVTGRWRVFGRSGGGRNTYAQEAGRAGEIEEQTLQRFWPGRAQCICLININIHISVKMALRHEIGVPDNTGIYHILMFRHTAIWPNHSKQLLVSWNMLYISDAYMHLYVMWNMSVLSVYLLLYNTINNYWVAGTLLA